MIFIFHHFIIIIMIPKSLIERLKGTGVYIYVKNIDKEFAGIIKSVTEEDIIVLEDNKNNITYIPIAEIDIITERR